MNLTIDTIEKEIEQAYKGILSLEQIEETKKWWRKRAEEMLEGLSMEKGNQIIWFGGATEEQVSLLNKGRNHAISEINAKIDALRGKK